MSRFRSLSALSVPLILAAGLIAVGGSTPDAAAAGADKSQSGVSYQVALHHGDGTVDMMTALDWSHEVAFVAAAGGGGGGAGKRQHKPFVITKSLDKSSPVLLKACATGQHFPKLQLDAFRTRNGRSEPYLTITLEDALISSFQTSGGTLSGPSAPEEVEHVTFIYGKITFAYRDFGVAFEDDIAGGA